MARWALGEVPLLSGPADMPKRAGESLRANAGPQPGMAHFKD